ncbi:MAG TPA: hypothetical protein VGL58_20715 [Caulobacteraceae bacterium]|jgi:hypothetical protein
MPAPIWMQTANTTRDWVRRNRGRRAGDRLPSLEQVLTAAVVLAWAWGVYEVARIFIR